MSHTKTIISSLIGLALLLSSCNQDSGNIQGSNNNQSQTKASSGTLAKSKGCQYILNTNIGLTEYVPKMTNDAGHIEMSENTKVTSIIVGTNCIGGEKVVNGGDLSFTLPNGTKAELIENTTCLKFSGMGDCWRGPKEGFKTEIRDTKGKKTIDSAHDTIRLVTSDIDDDLLESTKQELEAVQKTLKITYEIRLPDPATVRIDQLSDDELQISDTGGISKSIPVKFLQKLGVSSASEINEAFEIDKLEGTTLYLHWYNKKIYTGYEFSIDVNSGDILDFSVKKYS